MENNHTEQGMKDAILRKIKTKELVMRPRAYFVLQVVLFVLVAILVLLISVFLFNFIVFSVRINHHAELLGFGPRGVGAFLHFFPWVLLLLDVLLVAALQRMLRWFRFGYKTPVGYLLAALVVLTLGAGFLVDETSINDRFLHEADEHLLSGPFADFYSRVRHPLPPGDGFCVCKIVQIDGNNLTVQDVRSTTTLQVLLPTDDPHATTTSLAVGDTVLVAGDRDGSVIEAFGVHKLAPRAAGMK